MRPVDLLRTWADVALRCCFSLFTYFFINYFSCFVESSLPSVSASSSSSSSSARLLDIGLWNVSVLYWFLLLLHSERLTRLWLQCVFCQSTFSLFFVFLFLLISQIYTVRSGAEQSNKDWEVRGNASLLHSYYREQRRTNVCLRSLIRVVPWSFLFSKFTEKSMNCVFALIHLNHAVFFHARPRACKHFILNAKKKKNDRKRSLVARLLKWHKWSYLSPNWAKQILMS